MDLDLLSRYNYDEFVREIRALDELSRESPAGPARTRLPAVGPRRPRDAAHEHLGSAELHGRGVWEHHLTLLWDGGAIHERPSGSVCNT